MNDRTKEEISRHELRIIVHYINRPETDYYIDENDRENDWGMKRLYKNGIIEKKELIENAAYQLSDLGLEYLKRILSVPIPKKVIRYE